MTDPVLRQGRARAAGGRDFQTDPAMRENICAPAAGGTIMGRGPRDF